MRTVPHATQGDGGDDDDDGRTAEDAELELAFRAGKDGALEAAYRRHGRSVYAFARRAAGDDLADELTQDVFVAAWASASRYDPDRGALGGWLLGICRHKVVDALRRRERAPARIERAGALAEPPPRPSTSTGSPSASPSGSASASCGPRRARSSSSPSIRT